MDEEGSQGSLGAYENMERSDIRPDFYAEDENNDDENKKSKSNVAKDALKKGESAAAKKGLETALNAATGGVGGTAMKALSAAKGAEKAIGSAKGGGEQSLIDGKSTLKKATPIVAILAILVFGYGLLSFVGQWLFPMAFKSRMVEDKNSTLASTTERTDALTNKVQLGDDESSSVKSGVIFEEMGFTDEQIKSLESAGLNYKDEDGTKALVFDNGNGSTMVVVSDDEVGVNGDEALAEGEDVILDSGASSNTLSVEEKKQQILDNLGIAAAGSSVVGFSEAMNDWNFKERFIIGTKSWRGNISGWFSDMTETVINRLGISRNNYKNFELTGDATKDEEAFLELTAEKPAASEDDDIGEKSLKERVEDVARASQNEDCGAVSAANDIEGVITADQTAKQVSAGSLWLEAIDKTMAGQGNFAPLTSAANIVVRNGAADTEGIHHLFGSGELDQHNDNLLSVSAEANIGGNGTANLGAMDDNGKTYRECVYEGNTNEKDAKGAIVKIGSMFKKILSWAKGALDSLKNLFKKFTGGGTTIAVSVLDPTIAKYERMKDQKYFTGKDSAVLGEALVSSAGRIMGEKAKTAGQVPGDNASVIAYYREQQEVIAEKAEFERRTKSPFDITSEHTFLGSLAYSLMPLAVSTQSISVTSIMSGIGNLFSSALTNLLPTSSAVSETDFTFSRGDCVLSNSLLSVADGYCLQYYISDPTQLAKTPVEIFDNTAKLRYDDGGYKYRSDVSSSDREYGSGALNSAEDSLSHHWPLPTGGADIVLYDGTANGCESAWKYTDTVNGTVTTRTYHLDEPVEWKYSRYTNFEYEGYKTGWPNRTNPDSNTAEREPAKNDDAPGECVLDFAVKDKQPIINQNGALMLFMLLSGQRGSDWGSTDEGNLEKYAKTDFTHGRVSICRLDGNCDSRMEEVAFSPEESRWIGGTAYTMRTAESVGGDMGGIYDVYNGDEKVFKDNTMGNNYFWEEQKIYQSYVELLEWMESTNKVTKANTAIAMTKYYQDNPLDNSYEGIIARYSGMSKDHVVAVLDLMNYMEFLAKYDPSDLYPLPVEKAEDIYYEDTEIVDSSDYIAERAEVEYEELRNRAVLV